jgi:hypothetical protein
VALRSLTFCSALALISFSGCSTSLPLRGVSEDAIIRGQDPAGLYAPTPIRRFRSDEASQPHPVGSEPPGNGYASGNRYAAVNRYAPVANASENNLPAGRVSEQSWPASTNDFATPEAAAPDASSTEMQNANPQLYLPLTLQDAIESALSDSSIVRTLEGRVNIAEITPNDVAIADARIDAERGRFQPELSANFDGSQVNQPPNAFFGPGIAANTRRDVGDANLRITQPLQTGGSVSIGIEPPTAYLYFPDGVGAGEFNPIYSTDYVIRVKQPVLWGSRTQDCSRSSQDRSDASQSVPLGTRRSPEFADPQYYSELLATLCGSPAVACGQICHAAG